MKIKILGVFLGIVLALTGCDLEPTENISIEKNIKTSIERVYASVLENDLEAILALTYADEQVEEMGVPVRETYQTSIDSALQAGFEGIDVSVEAVESIELDGQIYYKAQIVETYTYKNSETSSRDNVVYFAEESGEMKSLFNGLTGTFVEVNLPDRLNEAFEISNFKLYEKPDAADGFIVFTNESGVDYELGGEKSYAFHFELESGETISFKGGGYLWKNGEHIGVDLKFKIPMDTLKDQLVSIYLTESYPLGSPMDAPPENILLYGRDFSEQTWDEKVKTINENN
ncbi:hypothetical protein [Fusibacter tunisiensis]|uniref:Uncharacterized protein n=1 Tax=Fusibacter tunisiensis TaxID=1008308 RepID=A0ABS2MQQ1_9FIRM|nr:hypothetical protein [Fusibacter tunisiensis]MBM7561742.1 hypothetical protein [Fusibacter tunisiensis]